MIEKIVIGAGLWAALQYSAIEAAGEQGRAVLDMADRVRHIEQDMRCTQAKAFGIDDLRRAGLAIECS